MFWNCLKFSPWGSCETESREQYNQSISYSVKFHFLLDSNWIHESENFESKKKKKDKINK